MGNIFGVMKSNGMSGIELFYFRNNSFIIRKCFIQINGLKLRSELSGADPTKWFFIVMQETNNGSAGQTNRFDIFIRRTFMENIVKRSIRSERGKHILIFIIDI
ncbi:hypothetical protein D3C71_1732290 [compost metagenome]